MNTPNPQAYFQTKDTVDALNQAVINKHKEIGDMRQRMVDLQTHIDDAQALITREERELSRPMSISRSTLTADQLIDKKRQLRDLLAEQPRLEEEMAALNTQLTGLQNDIQYQQRIFDGYREGLAERLADRMVGHILDSTGEAFDNLVLAMVVARGVHTGNTDAEQKIFFERLGVRILAMFRQGRGVRDAKPSGVIPELFEARQRVENLFHLLEGN